MSVLPVTNQHDAPAAVLTLRALAEALGGVLEGDGEVPILQAVHPLDAENAADLVVAMTPAILAEAGSAAKPAATAVLTHADLTPDPIRWPNRIKINRPRLALAELTNIFVRKLYITMGIHPSAVIHASAQIAESASIGALSVIGPDVVIGAGTVLMPGVTIARGAVVGQDCVLQSGVRLCEHVTIGNRCILHPNAVIGGDGFSFVTPEPGSVEGAKNKGAITETNTELRRIASLGGVIVADDVEVGCNSTIDRGTLRATTIGRNTKIDNQVQIGHNVQIGENCMICGHVGIAGSVVIGNRVVLGGKAGVSDHCRIGDDVVVGGGAGVATNIQPRSIVLGTPAQPREKVARQLLNLNRLPQFTERLERLEAQLKALEKAPEKG